MARQILRFLGTRYGIAVVLFALVISVVAVARTVSGPRDSDPIGPPPAAARSGPAASTDLSDDGVADSDASPVPSSIPGRPAPDAVALDFARAWINTNGRSNEQWLKGMEPHATKDLLAKLKGVDPTEVPADAIVGPAVIVAHDEQLADVRIPVRPGMLVLRMTATNGRWLVDGIDWERP